MAAQREEALEQLRGLALALPETSERLSHGAPTFFVRGQRSFAIFAEDGEAGRPTVWCPAPEGVQEAAVAAEPHRFFRPPYVGVRGWLGLRLDVDVDWPEVAAVLTEAYCEVAPAPLRERALAAAPGDAVR